MTQISRIVRIPFAAALLFAVPGLAFAQMSAPSKPAIGTPIPPSEVYGKILSNIEQEFVSAAEAMPEDKYDFAPTQGNFKGVRTFAEEVKHVTEANDYYFHDPAVPLTDFRSSIEKLKTKAEIVAALKDSFAQGHALVNSITPDNAFLATANGTRAGNATMGLEHAMDHYGQMVEYLRMNGIVPPASQAGNR
jgi:DinB family protein